MLLGYPLINKSQYLDAPAWCCWWSCFGQYQAHWRGNRVDKVTGHPETVTLGGPRRCETDSAPGPGGNRYPSSRETDQQEPRR